MTMRFATASEAAEWDSRILANPDGGNLFQSDEFAEQKKATGWTPLYVVADAIALTVLEKPVPILGKLWYIAKGPGVTSSMQISNMLPDLRTFAADNGAFAVKIEPELPRSEDTLESLLTLGLKPVPPVQPHVSTVLIDLSPDIDTVMANFNQKGRHAIKRAERDGVTVERVDTTEENCKIFYDLFTKTAQGSFIIRPYEYYREFWQRFVGANMGQMFFASFNGQVVSAAYAIVFGEKSTYKDGASIRVEGMYGASHLLQWDVIKWAKERGSKQHDLCGSPPSDRITDESHPYYGMGRFKTSFNKQVTDYVGAFDLVTKPKQYDLWRRYGERAAKSLWWRQHHESWY